MSKLNLALVILVTAAEVYGYSGGAGPQACENSAMAPDHLSSAQTGPSPYNISTSGSEYQLGGSLTGT